MSRSLFCKLFRLHLLTPRGLFRFLCALRHEGVNLMSLTRFAERYYPSVLAVADEKNCYTYRSLHAKASEWVSLLYDRGVRPGMRCALLGRNTSELVIASLALSRLGVHIYYMSTDLCKKQVEEFCQERHIEMALVQQEYADRLLDTLPRWLLEELSGYEGEGADKRIPRGGKGRIIVLTGGSSGHYKVAPRKPSVTSFLNPFFALLRESRLDECQSVYIAPPLYHGFGLASLIVAIVMGKTVYLRQRFDPEDAIQLISKERVEVLIAVPLMLRRLMATFPRHVTSIQRILSGAAPLDVSLVRAVEQLWGLVLFNLYGTSEAGFFVLATPEVLHYNPLALGKTIRGVRCKVVDPDEQGIGRLVVKSGWAMDDCKGSWQETGDLVVEDGAGVLFLKGRADSMIVSGGENVYPEVLREAVASLTGVQDVAVIAYPDLEFGSRLAIFVTVAAESTLSEESMCAQLSTELPRYQMPGQIHVLPTLPCLGNGKISEVVLRSMIHTC